MSSGIRWRVRLTATAEKDYIDILRWTESRFGAAQAQVYANTLALALTDLAKDGPAALGVKARDDIGKGLFAMHVARRGRKGRHFAIFCISGGAFGGRGLDLVRILHDSMDLARHVPNTGEPD